MPIEHVPARWRPGAERLRGVMLTDASLLAILGVVFVVRGLGFLPPPGADIHPWELSAPALWGVAWVSMGTICLVTVPWHASRIGAAVLGIATGLLVFWGMAFVLVDLDELMTRGAIYLGWAVTILWAVWRGRRGEIVVRHVAHGSGKGRDDS